MKIPLLFALAGLAIGFAVPAIAQQKDTAETGDQYSPHIIGTAGNEAWTSEEWTTTLKGQNFGPVDAKGN